MKRFTVLSIAFIFAISVFIMAGCGGKSQKINGVADEESQVMDEASQASKESLPATYTAEEGDTLWSIAQKAEIYGNAQQWPIIYDNNRDILDDYKKPLEEGTKLIIPRNISAVEIEAAKEKAAEYGMPPGQGSKNASSGDEESSEDAQNNVAGMDGESSGDESSATDASAGSDTEEAAGEPTPIPEPVKAKKKGPNNMMMILLALLGVIAVIIFFIISKQKKKEEEEEKGEGETKTNILD